MLKKLIFIILSLWAINVLANGVPSAVQNGSHPPLKYDDQPKAEKTTHQFLAGPHGFYVGAQAGYSSVDYQNSTLKFGYSAHSIDNTGLAPHIYVGYAFNPYIANELGVIYVNRPTFKGITGTPASHLTHIKNNIVYLNLRLGLPIWRFNFYIKGGIGYIVRDGIFIRGVTVLPEGEIFTATYGAGVLFQLGRHWLFDNTWMQVPANSSERLPVTNFFGTGLIYQF